MECDFTQFAKTLEVLAPHSIQEIVSVRGYEWGRFLNSMRTAASSRAGGSGGSWMQYQGATALPRAALSLISLCSALFFFFWLSLLPSNLTPTPLSISCNSKQIGCWHVTFASKFLLWVLYEYVLQVQTIQTNIRIINNKFEYLVV